MFVWLPMYLLKALGVDFLEVYHVRMLTTQLPKVDCDPEILPIHKTHPLRFPEEVGGCQVISTVAPTWRNSGF